MDEGIVMKKILAFVAALLLAAPAAAQSYGGIVHLTCLSDYDPDVIYVEVTTPSGQFLYGFTFDEPFYTTLFPLGIPPNPCA